jgi:CRISPR type III-A-associated RAMP protein Csm4
MRYQLIEKNKRELGVSKHKLSKIWASEITQRVWINENPNYSTPFYLEKLYPMGETGLYFIVHNNTWQSSDFKLFEGVLKLLGQNGIGLQRNLGHGRFDAIESTLNLDLPQGAETWVSLSLYRPENKKEVEVALNNDDTNYQFIKRGGWMSSPENDAHISVRKQSVMMFTEGSVFAHGKNNEKVLTKGHHVNLKPNWDTPMNDVYRDGKAIFLPILLPKV